MAIRIPFVADVAGFLRGTSDMEESLQDVADALDDLGQADTGSLESDLEGIGKAAETSAEQVEDLGKSLDTADKADLSKLEGEIKGVGDQADLTGREIKKRFKETFDAVGNSGQGATRKLKADLKSTGDAGSNTLREFSSEAKQNVGETISSFNGSAASGVDAIQGTLGGLVSSLGPAGFIGAAVVGVGIGLARGLFDKAKQAAEDLRESIGDIFDELRENDGALSNAFQTDQMADLLRDTEEFKKQFGTDIPTAMKSFGDSFGTVMQGLTGDSEDVAEAQAAVEAAWQAAIETGDTYVDEMGNVRLRNVELEETFGRTTIALKEHGKAVDGGVTANQALTAATEGLTEGTEDSTEALVSENEQMRISAGLKNDAVTSELDLLDALDAVTAARDENGKSLSKNTEAGRENLRAIDDARKGIIDYGDALVDAGASSDTATHKMEAQERVLINKVMKAFNLTETQAKHYIKTLGGIPPVKNTSVKVDDHGTAKNTSDKVDHAARDRDSRVIVDPDFASANQQMSNWLSSGWTVRVKAVVDTPGEHSGGRRGESRG